MVSSHKEMSHILGLSNFPGRNARKNTGWNPASALASMKKRYQNLSKNSSDQLNCRLVTDSSSAAITKEIETMEQGAYLAFLALWWFESPDSDSQSGRHAYTIHAVKDGENTHFIYVNRGQPHNDSETKVEETPRVFAFTLTNPAAFSEEFFSAAKSENAHKQMSKFLEKNKDKVNKELSNILAKKSQKTGNCTIANSNISWHFQLASNYMKQNPGATFAAAYQATNEQYRQMRLIDRKNAFDYLLNDRLTYANSRNFLFNYFQVIEKFDQKDFNDSEHFQILIDSFDPATLQKLIKPLLSVNFTNYVEQYCEDRFDFEFDEEFPGEYHNIMRSNLYLVRNNLLTQSLQKLSINKQEALIKDDISLLKGAAPNLQRKYLDEDFNKYAIYASPEIRCSYPSFDEQKFRERNNYFKLCIEAKSCLKTSGDFLFLKGSAKKEMNIDNQFGFLCSYLLMDDSEKVKKTFEALCKTCSEKRIHLFGNKYSPTTASSQWLIQQLQSEDEVIKKLLATLEIEPKNIHSTVEKIIAKQNLNSGKTAGFFQNRPNTKSLEKTLDKRDSPK